MPYNCKSFSVLNDIASLTGGKIINVNFIFNTLRTGDADLLFYVTIVQDG